MRESNHFRSEILIFLLVALCSQVFSATTRKLREDEVDPAILSTIMFRNTRLESEKHRENKSIVAALTSGNGVDAGNSEKGDITGSGSMERSGLPSSSKAKQDAIIRQLWGGTCKLDDWIRCNNITTWGGDYFFKEQWEHFEMECTTFKSVCMRNGWTVNRCHLLCMSSCNRDLLVTNMYDKYVLHEGVCPPISKKVRR